MIEKECVDCHKKYYCNIGNVKRSCASKEIKCTCHCVECSKKHNEEFPYDKYYLSECGKADSIEEAVADIL
jgi:hypothetical protein